MSAPVPPQKLFDFSDFQITNPNRPLPGDEVDRQFSEVMRASNETITALSRIQRSDGRLANQSVSTETLTPGLYQEIIDAVTPDLQDTVDQVNAAAAEALTHANEAGAAAADAENARDGVQAAATIAVNSANSASGSATQARSASATAHDAATSAQNAANSAETSESRSSLYAILTQAWAEHMPDTIPPNILAEAGISGDHWSSRWWATQANFAADRAEDAANTVVTLGGYYLGAFDEAPDSDPISGRELRTGAIYYNLTREMLYVWNNVDWQPVTVKYTEAAIPVQTNIPIDTNLWNFDGTRVDFPIRDFGGIPVTPAHSSGCLVSLDGVLQDPDTYAIDSDILTFTNPPPANTRSWMVAGVAFTAQTFAAGEGDMLTAVYDPDRDGRVNSADHATAANEVPWTGVQNRPSAFPPSAHAHPISDVTNLQAALDGKADDLHTHTIIEVTGLDAALSSKAPLVHTHDISDVSGLQGALDGKQAAGPYARTDTTNTFTVDQTFERDGSLRINMRNTAAGGVQAFWRTNATFDFRLGTESAHAVIIQTGGVDAVRFSGSSQSATFSRDITVTGNATINGGNFTVAAVAANANFFFDSQGGSGKRYSLLSGSNGSFTLFDMTEGRTVWQAAASGSVNFPLGITAPTRAFGDNSTNLATTAFVREANGRVNASFPFLPYTLAVSDVGGTIFTNSGGNITVPGEDVAIPNNARFDIVNWGGGDVWIVGAAGVGVSAKAGHWSKINGRYAAVTLIKLIPNVWALIGDLEPQ